MRKCSRWVRRTRHGLRRPHRCRDCVGRADGLQCAPCVGDINNDGKDDPDWNEVTSFGPWEPFFDATNGKSGDKKRAWESGVDGANGGSWDKTFPLAE